MHIIHIILISTRLAGTTLVSAEPDQITQEIRTVVAQIPSFSPNDNRFNKSIPFRDIVSHTSINRLNGISFGEKEKEKEKEKDKKGISYLSSSGLLHRDSDNIKNDSMKNYFTVTILDTPGQEIFYRMRSVSKLFIRIKHIYVFYLFIS